jgi:DNA processing protein
VRLDRLDALLVLNSLESLDGTFLERLDREKMPPEAFLAEGVSLWGRFGLSERARTLLSERLAAGWPERERERCAREDVRLCPLGGAEYPEQLLRSPRPPLLLYVRGGAALDVLAERAVGVVGTRRCSPYARRMTRELVLRLARRGLALVSGGARGIDAEAHEGALAAGGRTAAVLGTGVDRVFPAEHGDLFRRIAAGERGCLISEFPLGAEGKAWRFPRRNRIIAGLSERIVVMEAPARSGALITAREALEAGREVWALPGRIDEELCSGSNRLLFDGATPLVDLDLLLGDPQGTLAFPEPSMPARGEAPSPVGRDGKTAPGEDASSPNLAEAERLVLRLLRERGDRTVDNLVLEGRMSAAEILDALARLGALGLVYTSGPGRFRAVPGSSL